jgi:hypothetical protein
MFPARVLVGGYVGNENESTGDWKEIFGLKRVCENDSLRLNQPLDSSNSLRNASQPFLSITPSSATIQMRIP